MNNDLIDGLNNSVCIRNKSKFFRILNNPLKQLYYKLLDVLKVVVPCEAQLFFGSSIKVCLPERVSSELYRYGYFEEGLTKALIKLLHKGDCFIDIGTHVGYYSVLASSLVGENGKVISFEPTERTRGVLEYNVKDMGNVTVEPFAVWSSVDHLIFQDFGWINSAFNTLYSSRLEKSSTHKEYQVQTIDLDTYISQSRICPSFIKIDAEGAELEILKGAKKTIKNYCPVISLEVGDFEGTTAPSSREMVNFLLDLGYSAYENHDGEFIDHSPVQKYGYDNLIFIHTGNVKYKLN